MNTHAQDTIAARATPPGRGGIAVIRVSGPQVAAIARALLGALPRPRYAELRDFRDATGLAIDTGIALYFPAPNSYTGEDVLELQGHGGQFVSELLLERLFELGARPAQPGEFSRRAFLNDKLDLSQAEAVADLIDSASRTAARAAVRSLSGAFSKVVLALNESVTRLRVHVEAAMDFPEEEIDFLADAALLQRLQQVTTQFDELQAAARQGRLLRDGVTVVIAGRPNAGKSSLLNALAGYEAAIVTDIAGTTRDLVREHLDLDGLPVAIIDTAGLRDGGDVVEVEGMRRARAELAAADHAIIVQDVMDPIDDIADLLASLPADLPRTLVRNKIDLSGEASGVTAAVIAAVTSTRNGLRADAGRALRPSSGNTASSASAATSNASGNAAAINVSARTGAGLDVLRQHLLQSLGYAAAGEGTITARQRHLNSLARARSHFDAAYEQLQQHQAGELMADELLQVQNALAEITGEFSSDDLLGEIFSSFCIGK